jgi:translocation protein SEC63
MFMKIAKAYEALTDDESRENWIKYGNPDGPQAATFGIALPSWVVEKQNSVFVLGLYMLVFIVILPIIVGTWWYRSIKYTTANLLIQTTQIFFHFLSKHRQLNIRRLLMVLTAAFEFNPQFSKLLPARPSDDEELSELIHSRSLPHISVKVKEPVLREIYAIKACILIHAHLEKVGLPPATLRPDQKSLLRLCPRLINEMISILNQVWIYAKYRPSTQLSVPPGLEVYETVMRLSQMISQQMWDRQSVLLQLPHVQTDMLRHFRTRRRNITTIDEFVAMKSEDRRSLVRLLSDEDYMDVMAVCSSFPHISITTETQVMDDDDRHKVTAGSMVTVTVTLMRTGLLEHHHIDPDTLLGGAGPGLVDVEEDPVINHNIAAVETVGSSEKAKPQRPWEKAKKKKKGKAGGGKAVKKRGGRKGKGAEKEDVEEQDEGPGEEKKGKSLSTTPSLPPLSE